MGSNTPDGTCSIITRSRKLLFDCFACWFGCLSHRALDHHLERFWTRPVLEDFCFARCCLPTSSLIFYCPIIFTCSRCLPCFPLCGGTLGHYWTYFCLGSHPCVDRRFVVPDCANLVVCQQCPSSTPPDRLTPVRISGNDLDSVVGAHNTTIIFLVCCF